jgi:hypothetical protein
MERPSFAGHYDVADVQGRILLDIVDHDAREISASNSPPPPPSHYRGDAAGVIGNEYDRTRQRTHRNDTADHAAGREHPLVGANSGQRALVDRDGARFVLGRKPDDARLDAAIEVRDGAKPTLRCVRRSEFVKPVVLFD